MNEPNLDYIAESLRPLAVPIDELIPNPRNPKKHTEADIGATMAMLAQYGQTEPIVCNERTGYIEAGHGRLEASKRLGWSHLAVTWVDDDPEEEAAFSIADNRTAELSKWDALNLGAMLDLVDGPSEADLVEACQFAELAAAIEPPAVEGENIQEVPERYGAVITCRDAEDQQRLAEKLEKEGFRCRALVV